MLGPVLPFRGGIAQHTTMLHRALPEVAQHLTVSFTRQYPALIFPGESDRDPAYEGHQESAVDYLIDSLNPLSWRAAVKRILAFKADIVVLPWWTVYWAFCFRYIAASLRKRGVEVVFFCHNVVEHESAGWKSALTKQVLQQAHRFVVHTREDQANLLRLLPGSSVAVHTHPIYDQFPAPTDHWPQRGGLELLFYGFVRPYKGLDLLIEAMRSTREDIHLTIAGEFWDGEDEVRAQIQKHGLGERIELRPRYHTDAETASLFDRCDVVVLPYRSATGSGVVPVAYHYDKPVLATQVGGLPDVIEHQHTGLLVPPEDVAVLAEAINSLDRSQCSAMVPAIQAKKSTMTWASLASTFLNNH